jgi:hypothetical protein
VIGNWGEHLPELAVGGNAVPEGKNFRYGFRSSLEGTDLVVWIRMESENDVSIRIRPVQ